MQSLLTVFVRRLSTIIGPLQKLRVIKFSLVDPLCRGEGGDGKMFGLTPLTLRY